MTEQCNTTAAWLNVHWVLQLLDEAEQRAKTTYDTKLEAAIVKRTGVVVPVKGWRGWLLKLTRVTTRGEAEQEVKTHGDWWYSIEYGLRETRDKDIEGISSLRRVAQVVEKTKELRIYVSKEDMQYLS